MITRFIKIYFLLAFLGCSGINAALAQDLSPDIRLNQAGYLPNAVKVAAVINTESDSFQVMTSDLDTLLFEGELLPPVYYSSSGEYVSLANFSLLTEPGEYVIVVNDLGKSFPFEIGNDVFTELSKATLKAYYYNRASSPVLSEYGGVYAREAGHPDTEVIVLPSAASVNRPAGTVISTPGGWYDAGDYNKYIVSSGISVFTLLSAYETYPEYYDTLNLNIPESNNAIPDILDEAFWNIKWMMTMQDADGGVYNKTTEANFSGFAMPSAVTSARYVTAKSTAATLDFAAIMAMTARIYKKFDPVLADSALNMAVKAWQWANDFPNVSFTNPSASGEYPAINTGGYGDSGFEDEFFWCASELYVTTKDSIYYDEIDFNESFVMPGWPIVNTLGLLSLLVNKDSLSPIADINLIETKFIDLVSSAKNNITSSPYRIPGDFYYWAGNNAFANWGMLFMQAFRHTADVSYFNAAIYTFDYLLGKNGTTYCFVTGTGTKSPMHIHHRISSADGVVEPVPGLLVCGADAADVYDCGAASYPSTFPACSYLDSECSYSTNEVAIGINAPLAFLAGAIESEYQQNFLDSMAVYFSISTNLIKLPSLKGDDFQVVIECNTDWELSPNVDWITISDTAGTGSNYVLINSLTDNSFDLSRAGIIYVYSQGTLYDSIMVSQNGIHQTGPYFGNPSQIPGNIEAENYDHGEINESWYDTDSENTGGAYRTDGVDISNSWDTDAGYIIGWITTGEWLLYTVDVNDTIADLSLRVAAWNSGGKVKFELDGNLITEADVPALQAWTTVTIPEVNLDPGPNKILKLTFTGGFDLNWINFESVNMTTVNADSDNNIKIYPVPADRFLYIEDHSVNRTAKIQILSVEGKLLIDQLCNGSEIEVIDVSGLSAGIYILKANLGIQSVTRKLIIK
jgi:endoglucanase